MPRPRQHNAHVLIWQGWHAFPDPWPAPRALLAPDRARFARTYAQIAQ